METNYGLAPSLGGQESSHIGGEALSELRVVASKATPKYWRLDLYLGDTLIGEYERSIEREIERKCGEISLAADVLIDVFRRRGRLQVRWNGVTRSKDIRVNGLTVESIPRDCWLSPTRRSAFTQEY